MRQFYLIYSIPQTVSAESKIEKSETLSRKSEIAISQTLSASLQMPLFKLSWSHYLILMRMDDTSERSFYEIESTQNNWSVRELKRQFDSALYQRLVLSRDKEKVKELSARGLVVEKAEDIIKDPYILEFLNLLQMYVNYYDRFVKLPIVLYRDKSEAMVEITLPEDNDQIFASRYKTVLPDREEFMRLLTDKDIQIL